MNRYMNITTHKAAATESAIFMTSCLIAEFCCSSSDLFDVISCHEYDSLAALPFAATLLSVIRTDY